MSGIAELRILSGQRAGSVVRVPAVPFTIGRGASKNLVLPEPGIWETHAILDLDPVRGYVVRAGDEAALLRIDGAPVDNAPLKNGEIIECGAVRLRFGLTPPVQRTDTWMVWAVTAIFILVFGLEIAFVTSWLI